MQTGWIKYWNKILLRCKKFLTFIISRLIPLPALPCLKGCLEGRHVGCTRHEKYWWRVQNNGSSAKFYKADRQDVERAESSSADYRQQTKTCDTSIKRNQAPLRHFENLRDTHFARSTKMVWKSMKITNDTKAKPGKHSFNFNI